MKLRFFILSAITILLSLTAIGQYDAKTKKLEERIKAASSAEQPLLRLQLASLYSNSDFSKAIENANKALDGAKKIKDNNLCADAFHLLGKISYHKNDLKNTLKYYDAELELREKMSPTKALAELYYTVASLYKSDDRIRRAISYFEKSLSTAQKLNNKQLIFSNYEALFSANYDQSDYKEAMKYFKLYIQVKDSLFTVKKSEEITKIATHYEVQSQAKDVKIVKLNELTVKQQLEIKTQELQIKTKELEISRKSMQRNLLLIILCFIGVAIFLLYNLYSSKKKANIHLANQNAEIQEQKEEIEAQRDKIVSQLQQLELLNHELHQQKEEIMSQRDEIEEKSLIIQQKNTDITKSIEYALHIQKAILPTDEEIKKVFPESFVLYKPKDIVSGDFYWIAFEGNKAFIAAVDCTGHGVPGGFMSMIGIEKLNDIITQTVDEKLNPAQVLTRLDKEIKKTLRQKEGNASPSDGMDIALCEFNLINGEVWYAGANRPLWLIKHHSGELVQYSPVKKGVGGIYDQQPEFTNCKLELEPDDMIYIFSDGYEDQFGGEKKRKLMKKNMKALLTTIHLQSPENQGEFLDNYFTQWKSREMQVDDVLVIGIRYKGV